MLLREKDWYLLGASILFGITYWQFATLPPFAVGVLLLTAAGSLAWEVWDWYALGWKAVG